MAINVKTMTITPAEAKKMLDTTEKLGGHNRKVSQNYVDLYANEMRGKRWKLNGEPIKLDARGIVLDGQHRLQACVAAGTPFETLVVTGVDPKTFDTLDCGRSRTPAQVLQMADVKYNSLIASIIRGASDLRTTGHTACKEKKLSNTATLLEYKRNAGVYNRAASVAASAVQESHAMTARLAGSVYYYLVHDLKQDEEQVANFIREITSFKNSSSDALEKLRIWNLKNKNLRGVSDRVRIGYLILTWNAMMTGSKKKVRFSESALDPMPKFITK